jgi:ABC-type lipoprotein export system ATPase subunit
MTVGVAGVLGRRGAEVAVEDIRKRYGTRLSALDGVSFRLAAGDFALLTGPSGCGKSTLLNMIAGLDRPDSGRVLVDGASVAEVPDSARFRREVVGIVFQLHHLIPGLTAEDNVTLPLLPAGVPGAERSARARAALSDVGLADRATQRPQELSGGERQRVAIARALVMRPRLLLADEPTGALDSEASAQVLELLSSLGRQTGMTVLMVSYDPAAARYANRVLRMHDGRLVGDEEVELSGAIRVPPQVAGA